jgi:hypothetical protein
MSWPYRAPSSQPLRYALDPPKASWSSPAYLGVCMPRLHPNKAPCVLRFVDRDTITVPKELNINGKELPTAAVVVMSGSGGHSKRRQDLRGQGRSVQ